MELPTTPPGMTENPKQGKGRVVKTIAISCGGMLLLIILSCVGLGAYVQFQQRSLLTSAQENHAANNYAAAVEDLETLIENHGESDQAAEAEELLPEVRLDWGAALREEQNFTESLARFDEVTDPAFAERAAEGQFETRLAWGAALLAESDFAAAQEQFEQVLNAAGEGSTFYDQARAALPDVYVGLAEEAFASGDAATAFQRLNYVFENYQSGAGRDKAVASFAEMAPTFYELAQQQRSDGQFVDAELALLAIANLTPDTELTQQVWAEFPAFYMEWGNALVAGEYFSEAADVYAFLIANYSESELVGQANAAMVDARVAAVASSGQAGELPAPQVGASSGAGTASYDVTNDTVCPIEVLMSGPQSQVVKLAAGAKQQVDFDPGTYSLVVQIDEAEELTRDCQDVIPFSNETLFEGGMIYYSSFYIETTVE